jgi:hypothetical protein
VEYSQCPVTGEGTGNTKTVYTQSLRLPPNM